MKHVARLGSVLLPGLLVLLPGCSYKKKTYFPATAVPAEAWTLTATLDLCQCAHCRLIVENPASQVVLLDRTDPPAGIEMTVTNCYAETDPNVPAGPPCAAEKQVIFGLECGDGDCRDMSNQSVPCTASATLKAGGVVVPGPAPPPTATCSTQPTPLADCQARLTLCIPDSAPTVNCSQGP